jgi:hypothetical protein
MSLRNYTRRKPRRPVALAPSVGFLEMQQLAQAIEVDEVPDVQAAPLTFDDCVRQEIDGELELLKEEEAHFYGGAA